MARPLKVAIIGGGPGGLATFIALQSVPNVEATIYEKASEVREIGAGISIGPNSWNVLSLLGVADSFKAGHRTNVVGNWNGKTGEELSLFKKPEGDGSVRIQRTALQAALVSHVPPEKIKLRKGVVKLEDLNCSGVQIFFSDGTSITADLVVGADGIRSVVRDSAWPDYQLKFTGTTIWRVLLPLSAIQDLDPRFFISGWWHGPTTHVYFSPVGEGLWEIAARAFDPQATGKVSWGVPVPNEYVKSHFEEYLPGIREALRRVPDGAWREFAAFAGPELERLTAWDGKMILVGDASHALSGAFGSGAGFAMEDGWILAQALQATSNNLQEAAKIFDDIRVPYYQRMYAHLESEKRRRQDALEGLGREPTYDERVRNKVIKAGGKDMQWIYGNDIWKVWEGRKSAAPVAASAPEIATMEFEARL